MSNSKDMSFLDHLEELRWHIIRSTIAVLLVAVLAFLAKDIIFDQIIFGPKRGKLLLVMNYFVQFLNHLEVMPFVLKNFHLEFKAEQFQGNFLLIFGHLF